MASFVISQRGGHYSGSAGLRLDEWNCHDDEIGLGGCSMGGTPCSFRSPIVGVIISIVTFSFQND